MYEEILNRMIDISPNVEEYISTKRYLPKPTENIYEEEESDIVITEQTVVNGGLSIIIEDLNTLGIFFHCETDEIFGNYYDANHVITLREVFDPIKLNALLKTNKVLRDRVSSLLSENTTQIVVNILNILSEYDKELIEPYTFLYDKIRNNYIFIKNITSIIDNIDVIEIDDMIDNDAVLRVIDFVDKTRQTAEKLILIGLKLEKLDADFLFSQLEKYNADKIAPVNINKFAFWLNFKDTAKDPAIKRLVQAIDKDHAIHNTHHIEYFERLEPSNITKEQILLILANCFEPDKENNKGEIYQTMIDYKELLLSKGHTVPDDTLIFVKSILDNLGA